MALQGISLMPKEVWNFNDLYSEKPDDTDQFLCKVLAAGAVAVYLEIITCGLLDKQSENLNNPQPVARANLLMNAILRETCAGGHEKLDLFDPFEQDRYLNSALVTQEMRDEYRRRTSHLFADFQRAFNCKDCVDILGFDPFNYEFYEEAIQEQIESGEWMAKCVACMQETIKAFVDAKSKNA